MINKQLRHPWKTPSTHQHHTPRHSVRLFPPTAGVPENQPLKSWSDWKNCFGQNEDCGNRQPVRTIILMEGVDPRFAELLGVQLGVPPEFWLAHCDSTCTLTMVDDKFGAQGCSTYWRASVPQFRGLPKNEKLLKRGEFFVEAGAFDRYSEFVKHVEAIEFEQRIMFESLVSFWGHYNNKDDWTGGLASKISTVSAALLTFTSNHSRRYTGRQGSQGCQQRSLRWAARRVFPSPEHVD